jgi:DNA-directed RNA polymerase III subunit RPC3
MRNGMAARPNGRSSTTKKQESDDEDGVRPSKRQKVTFEDEMADQEEEHQSRTVQLKNHLQILANDSCRFLTKVSPDGQGEWTVEFEHLSKYLRESELDKMILENYGPSGHRLVRMMRKVGKLEEKMIPNLGMMKQSEIRTKLAEMHMAGLVDIQEVARDAQHTIARTIFLWYFDEERVTSIYLNRLYKCMTRCFQRLEVEKRGAKDVLTILQRQDVRGRDPEEFLEADSLNKLQTFQFTEDTLLAQIGRLDDLISIFQDY